MHIVCASVKSRGSVVSCGFTRCGGGGFTRGWGVASPGVGCGLTTGGGVATPGVREGGGGGGMWMWLQQG